MIGESQFADLMIQVDNKTIPAHRVILTHRSEYFRRMFNCGMTESTSGKGGVTDILLPGDSLDKQRGRGDSFK